MTDYSHDRLTSRQPVRLHADPSRVITRLFVAGQEVVGGSESRASGVVGRLLALDEEDVKSRLEELISRFGHRHHDIVATFRHHAERIGNRLDPDDEISDERLLLLGATFTHEYAIEAASLCNPSMVVHPDQDGAPAGGLRFLMSVRGIGEGHRSSIGFRSGTITADGVVTVDLPQPFAAVGSVSSGVFDREVFHARLLARGQDGESAAYVLDHLGETFSAEELEARLTVLESQLDTRRDARSIANQLRDIASLSYTTTFSEDSHLSERVLWPAMEAESHGMEDARFVRFVDDDGQATYYATYTAFDGREISQQLLHTTDFTTFAVSPMVGPAAANKGLALFPRHVAGRFAAMSRHDRETNAVAFSDFLGHWDEAATCQTPETDWELIQLGNCGSPIETDAGWLVLTHAVGPMRTYSMGALLLDIDDPTTVVAQLDEPLLTPTPDEQDGYVPNVVYSCGGLLHGDTLVIPYGIADGAIGIATVRWSELRDAMSPR